MQPVPMMGMAPLAPTSAQMGKTPIQTATTTTTSLNNNSITQVSCWPVFPVDYHYFCILLVSTWLYSVEITFSWHVRRHVCL